MNSKSLVGAIKVWKEKLKTRERENFKLSQKVILLRAIKLQLSTKYIRKG